MSALPWFKCNHQDLLDGMAGMPADERGIYISVLCLIYRNAGPVRDEAREMAYLTGCTVARWTKYRAALILHGKLKVVQVNGRDCLSNDRCEEELAAHDARSESLAERGSRGGKKRVQNSEGKANENNEGGQASAKARLKLIQADLDRDIEGSEANASGAQPPEPPSANKKAWDEAVPLLLAQGGMTSDTARAFFGRLLAQYGLEAGDLLGAIGEAFANATKDPQGYLTKAAQGRSRRKASGPQKRVGFV